MAKIDKAYIIRIPRADSMQLAAECAASCTEHGIPYEYYEGAFQWSRTETTARTGWVIREESHPDWHNEFMCTMSHMTLWRHIIRNNETVAVLEHDAFVTGNFMNVEVHDGTILNLGYRVDDPSDYKFPEHPTFKQIMINEFEGTHAYAITPKTAQASLDALERQFGNMVPMPIDGLMGIHNLIEQQRLILLPTPAVGWVRRDAKSSTMKDENCARYFPIPPNEYWDNVVAQNKYTRGEIGPGIPRIKF